jgi:hypothetical protein
VKKKTKEPGPRPIIQKDQDVLDRKTLMSFAESCTKQELIDLMPADVMALYAGHIRTASRIILERRRADAKA